MPGWDACKGPQKPGEPSERPTGTSAPWAASRDRSEAYELGWEEGRAALRRDAASWADSAMALFEEPETPGADVLITGPIHPAPAGTPIVAPDAMLPESVTRAILDQPSLEPFPGLKIVSWEGMDPGEVGWFRLPTEGDVITVYRPDGPPGRYLVEKATTDGEGEPILQTLRLRLAPCD